MSITEHLINYRFYLANIKALEESIKVLRMQQDGQKGIDYSKDQVSTYIINNTTESTILNIIEKETELQHQKLLVETIDSAVYELEDIDRKIIKLKYMDRRSFGVSWEEVAREMGYDRRQCIRRKDKALEKIEIVLSGVV